MASLSTCELCSLRLSSWLPSLGPDLTSLSPVGCWDLLLSVLHQAVLRGGVALGRLGGPVRVAPGQGGSKMRQPAAPGWVEAQGVTRTPPQVETLPILGCDLSATWEQTQLRRKAGGSREQWFGQVRAARAAPCCGDRGLVCLLPRLPCGGGFGGGCWSPVLGARQGRHTWLCELVMHTPLQGVGLPFPLFTVKGLKRSQRR